MLPFQLELTIIQKDTKESSKTNFYTPLKLFVIINEKCNIFSPGTCTDKLIGWLSEELIWQINIIVLSRR